MESENPTYSWCYNRPISPDETSKGEYNRSISPDGSPKGEYNFSLLKRWEKKIPSKKSSPIINEKHDPEKARLQYNKFHRDLEKKYEEQEKCYFEKLKKEDEKYLKKNEQKIQELKSQWKKDSPDDKKKFKSEYQKKWRENNQDRIVYYRSKFKFKKTIEDEIKKIDEEIKKIEVENEIVKKLKKLNERKACCLKLLE